MTSAGTCYDFLLDIHPCGGGDCSTELPLGILWNKGNLSQICRDQTKTQQYSIYLAPLFLFPYWVLYEDDVEMVRHCVAPGNILSSASSYAVMRGNPAMTKADWRHPQLNEVQANETMP